ncbi:hypothetical protein BpHYR1_022855 [Brachionus plicatilis]|uniref:Uncharacterized protein n=1 Tax=Brachionus plicatilis TaxID=10195 RepID=A0A3M7RMW4_BRAPC|nr:hypothetical protein BpHYR1_022855 [Brachionus plicatilis]
MSQRKAALEALELLKNADDTQSEVSDDNDYENNDDYYFEEEMEIINIPFSENDDSDEGSDNEEPEEEETKIDKTSKNGTIWVRLNDGEETSLRKKISFNEKAGPASYATLNILLNILYNYVIANLLSLFLNENFSSSHNNYLERSRNAKLLHYLNRLKWTSFLDSPYMKT